MRFISTRHDVHIKKSRAKNFTNKILVLETDTTAAVKIFNKRPNPTMVKNVKRFESSVGSYGTLQPKLLVAYTKNNFKKTSRFVVLYVQI